MSINYDTKPDPLRGVTLREKTDPGWLTRHSGPAVCGSTSETAYTLCVMADFPGTTGEAFLDELAANPGKYAYANDGIGGTMQLAAERIFQEKGIEAVAIPFGGAKESLQNVLGGHADIYDGSISTVLPHVEAGTAVCPLMTSAADVVALPGASGLAAFGMADKETLL